MKNRFFPLFLCLSLLIAVAQFRHQYVRGQAVSPTITILNNDSRPITRLTDGDEIHLQLTIPAEVQQELPVSFQLDGTGLVLTECTIPPGETTCETEPFPSLGWHWGSDGTPQESREVVALSKENPLTRSAQIQVAPRPVVMVHGFSSSWEAWSNYVGEAGYLASAGIPGFAVGDGQTQGTMNTGRLDQPAGRTYTIAENAAILREYILGVLEITGAQKVDLLAHSMGGLISRYYIARVMEDEVAQLIMLGSPMAGTECANLPAALNFYHPAALEIQPLYVNGIFNQQITHRKGVPFYAIAGVPIQEAIQSPCTPVPTDLAVSLESVRAIPLILSKTPVLHTELNTSEQVFREEVLPLLQTPAGEFPGPQPDPAVDNTPVEPLQFSRVFTGHIDPGGQELVVVPIEEGITLASFALYDSSRSLETVVQGASGNVIEVTTEANGLVRVEDPSMLLYLGYGFNNPNPGEWRITLQATGETPPEGADYALMAVFHGGAELHARTSVLLPEQDQPLQITAELASDIPGLGITEARANVRLPDESEEEILLEVSGNRASGEWTPHLPGLSYIQVFVEANGPEEQIIDRTAFLVVETQPPQGLARRSLLVLGVVTGSLCAGLVVLVSLGVSFWRRKKDRTAR